MQAMVGRGLDLSGATVRGVIPEMERNVSSIGDFLVSGSLDDLVPGERHMLLGMGLAWTLGAQVGDELTVLIPQVLTQEAGSSASIFELRPRIQSFTVSGIFDTGLQDADAAVALIHMEDAAQLAGTAGSPTGLRLKFADIFAAPTGAPRVAEALGGGFEISDWSKENASYFRAVRIEKTMMTLILMLIVAVAAFNIVAALVMVVNEKRNDIAILLTLGLSPRSVVGIFMTQGVIIGWAGALFGVALGLVLSLNIDTIVPFLEQLVGRQALDPEVFAISKLPSDVQSGQVIAIATVALVLSILSTIYPSLRASRTEPAAALRYE
jgi:lipoprotein-releasing system permease protein